ncbi:MAG: dienelactone hydrolase family protein [Candidatus Tyrphobacter sp.]
MQARAVEQLDLCIPVRGTEIWASMRVPANPLGLVVFAHGSGSSRHSPRNRLVALALGEGRLGTLLVDLLSIGEAQRDEMTAEFRFDIHRLAERLVDVTGWAGSQDDVRGLPIGYFGASTGAAAALVAAAALPETIKAVVSRGGRPDLAMDHLGRVRAPTLLIVGGADTVVIDVNRQAMERMSCERDLVLVKGATHLFEEPGALERVAELARAWFVRHFSAVEGPS